MEKNRQCYQWGGVRVHRPRERPNGTPAQLAPRGRVCRYRVGRSRKESEVLPGGPLNTAAAGHSFCSHTGIRKGQREGSSHTAEPDGRSGGKRAENGFSHKGSDASSAAREGRAVLTGLCRCTPGINRTPHVEDSCGNARSFWDPQVPSEIL